MNQSDLSYECLIDNHIKHVLQDYKRHSIDDAQSQLWFLTATFSNQVPISPDRVIAFFERFYVWLLPRLMSNFERKRHLQPLVYLYVDYPFTKRDKTYAPLTPNAKFYAN